MGECCHVRTSEREAGWKDGFWPRDKMIMFLSGADMTSFVCSTGGSSELQVSKMGQH